MGYPSSGGRRRLKKILVTGSPVVSARPNWGELPAQEQLGVAVLGLHEGATMLVAAEESRLCKPVVGCDLSEAKRTEAAVKHGILVTDCYEQVLQNPDVKIVAIYTPDALHADHILSAFQAGKHVICTKPLINDLSRAEELLQAAKRFGVRLQVGQSTRFGEPFLRQREMFEQGHLGEIEVVDAHYNHRMDWYYEKSPWTVDETHWAYLGLSHPVDLVRWYLGPIREVQAIGTTTTLGNRFGLKTPDAICVNLVAESGRIGRVLGNYGFHDLRRARSLIECLLMGSKGTSLARYPELKLTYHNAQGTELEEDYTQSMTGYYYRHELVGMHYGEFGNYLDHFASAILTNSPNSPDLIEGIETVAVMDAIVRALQSGKPERPILTF